MSDQALKTVDLVAFDIDGTLTDATTSWLGPEIGWTQRYSTRDGEAILSLLRASIQVAPLSRNRTECARVRMTALGLPLHTLGVKDKVAAVHDLSRELKVPLERVCYIGDGAEDAAVFALVAVGCAVADAHPLAREAATFCTKARGGERAFEELAHTILRVKGLFS
jgi:3-deoxy-D-manno-octulosonate 8-phosphate phosphatase (KDO 8-P phosphatase)